MKKNILFCLYNFLIYFVGLLTISLILRQFINPNNFSYFSLTLINLIPPLIITIFLLLLNIQLFKNKFNNFKTFIPKIFKYWLCGLLGMIICSLVVSIFTPGISANEEAVRSTASIYPIYTIIYSIILAPICEELVFRGSIKPLIKNKNIYCLISALLFGLLHVISAGDYINIFSYAAIGFFFAKLYYETDNILTTISAHAFHNAFCLLLFSLGGII